MLAGSSDVTSPCCDLHATPLSDWAKCRTLCAVPPHTNGSRCIPGGEMGIGKAMGLSVWKSDTLCIYLTGFPKSGTSFATFFGAQIMRLGCTLSHQCSMFEAEWPAPSQLKTWEDPTMRPLTGNWSKKNYDPDGPEDPEAKGKDWRGMVVATAVPAEKERDRGWRGEVVATSVPKGGLSQRRPVVQWTQDVTKHVGLSEQVPHVAPPSFPSSLPLVLAGWLCAVCFSLVVSRPTPLPRR